MAACLLGMLAALAGGCAPPVARSFAFERPEYDRVFDAALEAARQAGLQPVVADRELGVIETGPRTAGSILEPWRTDNDGLGDTMASTVNLQRRRARFEFVPEGFAAPEPRSDQPSRGPAIAGSDRAQDRFDLVTFTGRSEVRAWVFVDRAFKPYQSFGRWTLGETRYASNPADKRSPDDPATAINTEWTPIGRDVPYEDRLMRRLRELLAEPGNPGSAATESTVAAER